MAEITLQEANIKLMEHVYSARGKGWFKVAKEIREKLLRISKHPKTRPKDRAQADMYLIYSYKGLYNYRVRVEHFIASCLRGYNQ